MLPLAAEVVGGRDPLTECALACRREGLQLHVWHNLLYAEDATSSVLGRFETEGRLVRDAAGQTVPSLTPHLQQNRVYIRDALTELARDYPIDGINLDYARYPKWPPTLCYGAPAREQFEAAKGSAAAPWPAVVTAEPLKTEFAAWSRDQLSALLAELRAAVRAVNPRCLFSIDVFGWPTGRAAVGQDLAAWLKQDCADLVCFMDYTGSRSELSALVGQHVQEVAKAKPVIIVLGPFSHAAVFESPLQLFDQVKLVRQLGADGFGMFQYTESLDQLFLPALAESLTRSPAPVLGPPAP